MKAIINIGKYDNLTGMFLSYKTIEKEIYNLAHLQDLISNYDPNGLFRHSIWFEGNVIHLEIISNKYEVKL